MQPKSVTEFPVKGSGVSPRNSSKLRVEVLYEALLVQHKCGTHKLYLAYEYVKYKVMQNIREKELRDSRSNANNKICLEIRATALLPAFIQKDFYYVYIGPSTKGPSLRNYCSTLGVHYSSPKYNHVYTRGIGTKPKQRKDYNLGDPMITNNTW